MSAVEKSSVEILGVIAGGGHLPGKLVAACDRRGIVPFVVAFENQTEPALVEGRHHMWARLGSAGQIINTLKSHGIRDIVFAGSLRRPSFSELRPDFRTAQFIARLGFRAIGDDGLLKAVRGELEHEGFIVHGIQEFADDLLAPEGALGSYLPKKRHWHDIEHGYRVAREIGRLDIGQAVIVQEGIVLAVEAAEGTDAMIRRSRALRRRGAGGVLVKACKPQQDRSLDLPTVGLRTLEEAIEAGLDGIAIEAGQTLLMDPQGMTERADSQRMFVVGINELLFESGHMQI